MGFDEHVRGLDILVQHANAVRGRHGIANSQKQFDTLATGHRGEPTLDGRPFVEIGAAIFGFEEERGLLEVPVDHSDEVLAWTQAFAQHTGQGRLPLERRQPLAIRTEFVDTPFVRLAMARQPDLAAARRTQLTLQHEMVSPRHGVAGLQIERTDMPPPDGDALDRAAQAIADARYCHDQPFAVLAERLA